METTRHRFDDFCAKWYPQVLVACGGLLFLGALLK
jgi:hypothetical protein